VGAAGLPLGAALDVVFVVFLGLMVANSGQDPAR
jgi:hypothetical protein